MRKDLHLWIALAVVMLMLLPACGYNGAPASETARTISLEPCWLSHPNVSRQYEARCGTLEVYEDNIANSGRKISLRVAVIPAESSNPEADPLFLLAGGPGQAASEGFVSLLAGLSRVNFKRDLVMVDQRGTGSSNPLDCPEPEGPEDPVYGTPSDEAEMLEWADACVSALNGDPRLYTTEYAARDLDAVRAALGYGPINLLGVSYGTRMAQVYQRMYPGQVRAMVLDGVAPMDWAIGDQVTVDAQRALDLVFARCHAEAGCREAFPGLREEFATLLNRLDEDPVEVALAHPITGEDIRVLLSRDTIGRRGASLELRQHHGSPAAPADPPGGVRAEIPAAGRAVCDGF